MHPKNRKAMAARVAQAADTALREKDYVTPIDVMLGIGWLQPNHVLEWRTQRLPFLERGIQASLSKISEAMRLFAAWARQAGLRPSTTEYLARTAARERLQFSKTGAPEIEVAERTGCRPGCPRQSAQGSKNRRRSHRTSSLCKRAIRTGDVIDVVAAARFS